ncbi:multifunctional CCA addition/repair protein [Nitrosomonas mobilis]|uniref:Multifunctional CCA protein n=1 Tax=Nitrosomonas mobilis TaxID=51642 RepID=A0A1G5SB15_9PROT|nr:multifunctional CCA addition/repair protein [Nitrosomonas mobilis]SCZ84383.1 fused tRNA nucleotidyl transferase; 2'3'-cyclic phosphodiesterase and 2'nucleotidase and phosphatase [Nitrosomonas mobilis]HNO76131.1 multifunctional CCA addition/repair protein [Nitrosomonas mobilis]
MRTYLVGGSVRDELLGLPVQDHDYVVVGATPAQLEQMGYRPVGKDFPVFLHPETHEQYALARTERKISRGYKGFEIYATPGVTLQEDLARRDLTINALAKDEHGEIIDPFGGIADLQAGILRHIGPAFVEDPVRVLRVARFAARLGFQVAPETLALMKQMVHDGEVDALVAERVWQEMARGLMESHPSRMFYVLHECGALARIMPEVDVLFGVPQSPQAHPEIDTGVHVMMVIDYAATRQFSLEVRFAALMHDLGKGTTPPEQWPRHTGHEIRGVAIVEGLCERLRVPGEAKALALLVTRLHGEAHHALELAASDIAAILQSTDAYRRPGRFGEFLQACASDFHGRPGFAQQNYQQMTHLQQALEAAMQVDAGAIASKLQQNHAGDRNLPMLINQHIYAARLDAINTLLRQS